MKDCNRCKFMHDVGYEYRRYECQLFGVDAPKHLQTERGCKLHHKEVEKMIKLTSNVAWSGWYGFEAHQENRPLDEEELKSKATYESNCIKLRDYQTYIDNKYAEVE